MHTKFASPTKGANTGSCTRVVNYLEKENAIKQGYDQEHFFSADREKCNKWEVIQQIDANAKGQGLSQDQEKFYSIVIAPSQEELAHIGNDSQKLKEYTRDVMENYAANFGKGIESKDLVWYAKVENQRSYTHGDTEVKAGLAKTGELKQGDQRHIHVIVSRCSARENRHVLNREVERKQQRTIKLSPLTNQRGQSAGAVKSGFNRDNFYRANEQTFDRKYQYERSRDKCYDYLNNNTKGKELSRNQTHQREKGLNITRNAAYGIS